MEVEEVISTTRLDLPRRFSLWHNQEIVTFKMASRDDAGDLVAALQESREHLSAHFDWVSLPQTYARQHARLKALEQAQLLKEAYNFHLYRSSKLMGSFSMHCRQTDEGPDWELGYWIHPDYLRQGLGTLALCSGLWLQREFLTGNVYLQVHIHNQTGLRFLAKNNLRAESMTSRTNLFGAQEEMMIFRPRNIKKPNFESSTVDYMIERWTLKLIEVEW
ncbi:MAG: GNAT family N-acetyltransferase [Pseudomonadota bacterium]